MTKADFFSDDTAMQPWPALAGWGKTISRPEGQLFFYDSANTVPGSAGQTMPTLFFIHGLGDEADTWRHLLPPLSRNGYRTIAPDLPGFGRSQWKGRISIKQQAEVLTALLEESGAASPEHPAVLTGSSIGAAIAEAIAFKRPDLVQALILIDGCYPVSGGADRKLLLLGLPFAGKRWYRGFRKNHEGAWKTLYAYYHNLDAMSEADRTFLRERVIARVESHNQERGYFASLRSLNRLLLFGKAAFASGIKKYPGRIHLIWGSEDHVIPPERTIDFRRLRPDAAVTDIAGAGHLPQQEKPKETAEAILKFLASL